MHAGLCLLFFYFWKLTRLAFLERKKLLKSINVYDQFLFVMLFSHILLDSLELLGIDFLIILTKIGFLFSLKRSLRHQINAIFI